ncbi:hypothetical protein [Synechococcus phage BUCT-ZZ01]|nr:hypothetical protein [Synechococcus phage BUCT-ZZ01]
MILDNLIALRIIYLLVQPFEKSEAFKLGVIDANGNPLLKIKDMSQQQKTNYTMLHRLVFRLKKIISAAPLGKTRIASIAAAYMLVKECLDKQEEPDNIEIMFEELSQKYENLDMLIESEYTIKTVLDGIEQLEVLTKILEDAVTTTAGVAGYEKPLKDKPARRIKHIKLSKKTFDLIKKSHKSAIKEQLQELFSDNDTTEVIIESINSMETLTITRGDLNDLS